MDRTPPFLFGNCQRLLPFAFLGLHLHCGLPVDVEKVAGTGAPADDWRIFAGGNSLQTAIEDHGAEIDEQLLAQFGNGFFALLIRSKTIDGHDVGHIWIDEISCCPAALDIDQALVYFGNRCGGRLPAGEFIDDLGFDCFRIDIADYDQRCIIGAIIASVEIPDDGAGSGIDVLYCSISPESLCIQSIGGDEIEVIFEPANLVIVAGARFRLDNAPLTIDRFIRDGDFGRSLAHQHQRSIDEFIIHPREIEFVDRVFEGGRSIRVSPECEAEPLEQLYHLAFRDIGRSVERHVFDDMSQPEFFLALIHPADIETETDYCRVLRSLVMRDRVFHTIGQNAEAHIGIGRNVVNRYPPCCFARG